MDRPQQAEPTVSSSESPVYSVQFLLTYVQELSGDALQAIAGIASISSLSRLRSASWAHLRSSMSVAMPYHSTISPRLLRTGSARDKNHRYSPSARRYRTSCSSGWPLASDSRHAER